MQQQHAKTRNSIQNFTAVQLHCCTTSLLYNFAAVQLRCCTTSLLYNFAAVQLHCCTTSLLYNFAAVQLRCFFFFLSTVTFATSTTTSTTHELATAPLQHTKRDRIIKNTKQSNPKHYEIKGGTTPMVTQQTLKTNACDSNTLKPSLLLPTCT